MKHRQQTQGEFLIVMHGALRNGDLMSEAIIESRQATAYAALALDLQGALDGQRVPGKFGVRRAAQTRHLVRKTGLDQHADRHQYTEAGKPDLQGARRNHRAQAPAGEHADDTRADKHPAHRFDPHPGME